MHVWTTSPVMSMTPFKMFRILFSVLLGPRYLLNQVYLCWKKPKIPGKRKTSGLINLVWNLKEKYCALENWLRNFPLITIVRGTFFVIKKAFKKEVKTKERSFKEFLLQKIASFESDNPNDFWEMVNELRQKSANQISDKIDLEEWFTYCRKLSTTHISAESGSEKLVD